MESGPRIVVIGAGLMGHGIAWRFAAAGHRVRVQDPDAAALNSLRGRLDKISALFGADGNISGRLVPYLLRCIVDEGVGWLRIHPLQWSSAREMLAVEAPDLIRQGGAIGLVPRTGRRDDGASRHWWRNRRWAGSLNTGRVQRYCLALVAGMIESSSRVVTYPEILQLAKRPYRRDAAQRAFVCATAALHRSQGRSNRLSPTMETT